MQPYKERVRRLAKAYNSLRTVESKRRRRWSHACRPDVWSEARETVEGPTLAERKRNDEAYKLLHYSNSIVVSRRVATASGQRSYHGDESCKVTKPVIPTLIEAVTEGDTLVTPEKLEPHPSDRLGELVQQLHVQ